VRVKKGKADEAIGELELLRRGNLTKLNLGQDGQDCLTFALTVPILRILLLEGLSNVLEAANQKAKEIEIWRELFSTSHDVGLLAGEAEAEQKIAGLEVQLERTDDALKDYAAAADLYRKLQNESLLAQVEVSQALLLIKIGRGQEAAALERQVASYTEQQGLRAPEFNAYGVLAEIYQPAGDFAGARAALEKALSLVRPGPFDEELDNRAVLEDYLFLADDYKALKIPTKELVAIDDAYFVAVHLKDEKVQQNILTYLDKRLKELGIRDLVSQRQKEGQLAESLLYSYILFIRDGSPSKPTDDQSNWQRILNLPPQIARQAGGATSLVEILNEIRPLVGLNKFPILIALAWYYITDGADPILAEKYAIETEGVIKDVKGDMTSLQAEAACILAVSYSRQGKLGIAKDRIAECTSIARKTGDAQSIKYSDIANVIVQTQLGNIAAARSSLENLTAKAPDDPKLHLQLAMSLANAKLYGEASAELDFATQRFIRSGNKQTSGI
jgi:tetratricopeptide (TPR) repeat protein